MYKVLLSLSFLLFLVCGCEQKSSSNTDMNGSMPPASPTTCIESSECGIGEYCDECASSSCPMCADCIGLCRASTCETETQATCEIDVPTCAYGSILVIQNECWECVDQITCESTPEVPPLISCGTSNDCPAGSICNPCGAASCPLCDDCISACQSVCESETEAVCEIDPPQCEENQVRVIRDGCWVCVSQTTCEP